MLAVGGPFVIMNLFMFAPFVSDAIIEVVVVHNILVQGIVMGHTLESYACERACRRQEERFRKHCTEEPYLVSILGDIFRHCNIDGSYL